jgi:hypothetical protein
MCKTYRCRSAVTDRMGHVWVLWQGHNLAGLKRKASSPRSRLQSQMQNHAITETCAMSSGRMR